MAKRETKAELEASRDMWRRDASAQSLVVRYLATNAAPEFSETVTWTEADGAERGEKVACRIRAWGLARADGGVVILEWRFRGDPRRDPRPVIEAAYTLHATRRDARQQAAESGRYRLSDALGRLYSAHVAAVQGVCDARS